MIAIYVFSFSILITSGIWVTDVFLKADKNLTKTHQSFIKKTKSTLKNKDGNISLMAALLTLMISGLLMFFALKFKVELKEARYRKESYLCFHYLNIETENYISDMAKFNITLRSAFAATFTGVLTAEAKMLIEVTTLARNARHLYYIKNLLSNKYCEGKTSSTSYLKNLPFKTKAIFVLDTNIDGTTKLRKEKWSTTLYKTPSGIRLKKSFCLKADYNMESVFFPNLKTKSTEISMAGFSQLNCSYGFL